MQFKRTLNGLTLIEILLSLVIASMILVFLVPQQLKYSHEQLVAKTVSEMDQLLLAARNHYQANRTFSVNNASAWPTTLNDLVSKGFLPKAALCSAWPKGPASAQNNANNNGNDCGTHQEYALFPTDSNGKYDTSVPGIMANGRNSGGNFWGVSLALPTAKAAAEVRERLPFATTCTPGDLSKTNTPCSSTSNIVTAVVPRPAQWPDLTPASYAKDGLIQSIGTVTICDNANPSLICSDNSHNTAVIDMPQNCGTDESGTAEKSGNPLIPTVFVYPLQYALYNPPTNVTKDPNGYNIRGTFSGVYVSVKVNPSNAQQWLIQGGANDSTSHVISTFDHFAVAYFTVCQPTTLQTGSWALTYGTT